MKYIYTFLFLICTLLANAQVRESYPVNCLSSSFSLYKGMEKIDMQKRYKQTVYWKRHKRFKRYAFSALGVGICSTFVGLIGTVGNTPDTNINWKDDRKVWVAVFETGIGLTVSSIPLFVISHKNKRKAKKSVDFSLNSSPIQLELPNGRKQTQYAVGACINF